MSKFERIKCSSTAPRTERNADHAMSMGRPGSWPRLGASGSPSHLGPSLEARVLLLLLKVFVFNVVDRTRLGLRVLII